MFTIYITSRQSYMTIQGGTLQLDPTRTFYDGDRPEERTRKLLGHITRREDGDPLKQASFDNDGHQCIYDTGRVGRPRLHWVREALKNTFTKLFEDEIFVEYDECIIFRIFCAAENRDF